ncbi:carbohydrate kinase family protein [Bosea sp. (in: a-proteobacteria)]|uniref:carbohydrate kinase family protein n=1 Tax=Bosea sp. (in: a-proteobacteria) TaxID=1871050 RepID=UPI003B3A6ADD
MTPVLVTAGGLTVDHVISADGAVALDKVGGNGAYSAVGARCWVDAVGLVSVAVSSYPRATLDRLRENGIALDGVAMAQTALRSGNWFIYDERGNRSEHLTSRPEELEQAGFPTDRLTPEQVTRWQDHLRRRGDGGEISYSRFRDIHPLVASQVPETYLRAKGAHCAPARPVVLDALLPLFNSRGMMVTLDAGWQLAELSMDEMSPFLAQVDAFLPSEIELAAIVPQTGVETALALVAERCRGTAAVKLGARGSLVWDKSAARAVPVPVVPTRAIDPTGAGDSFCGGFLAGLVETGDPVLAAAYGAVSASLIVGRYGADGALPVNREDCRATLAGLIADLGRFPLQN